MRPQMPELVQPNNNITARNCYLLTAVSALLPLTVWASDVPEIERVSSEQVRMSDEPIETQRAELQLASSSSLSTDAPVLVVTGTRHRQDKALINRFVSVDEVASLPFTVTDLLAQQPGLAANGQPGLFQTLSIRGLARQRVQAYVNGMRITSERRAGVAASFIDPLLMAGVETTQGPASTYYGSGAIGGTIHLVTRQEAGVKIDTGYKTDGNERVIALNGGGEQYAAGFAVRERDNGKTIDGDEKNDHFSQVSMNYWRQFELGDYQLEWQLLYSDGDDLGKDNARFPDSRITHYPGEDHLLSQLTLKTDGDWQARIYFHDQSLVTEDIRPSTQTNRVTNDSMDIGLAFEHRWQFAELSGMFGVDYFGRRDVNSDEVETDLATLQRTRFQALQEGEENEAAVFATIHREIANWTFNGGVRLNHQTQRSLNSASLSEDYVTYFATASRSFDRFELNLSYGTGFRFASLSERLFSGTTGRGQTIGNPNLRPEESASLDLGLVYRHKGWLFESHYFRTDIDHFIERISLNSDTRSYANIAAGEITGWQYQLAYQVDPNWSFELSGQAIAGHDQQRNPLADIPADRYRLVLRYDKGDWINRLALTHRLAKNDAADGELALESANIASLRTGYRWNDQWTFDLVIDNLLNERYFNSADDLGTLATGREFAVNFAYRY